MSKLKLSLFGQQVPFVKDLRTPFTAFTGGFRSGKTFALMCKSILLAANNPGSTGAICLPTNGMIGRGFKPEWEQFLETHGIRHERIADVNGYHLYFNRRPSRVLLLSAENYMRARNLELAWAGLDETDAMQTDRAYKSWDLFISRLSGGRVQHCFAVSTPEGYNFMANKFQLALEDNPKLRETYKLYRGSTEDNPHLPADYIKNLKASYPPNLIKAYIEGQFVNLTSGAVYPDYNEKNYSSLTLETIPKDAPLHLGMDFNANNMSIVSVYCGPEQMHVIHEIMGSKNTPEAIRAIKETYPNRYIVVYPDASSSASKTSATQSDLTLLKQAGFDVQALYKNPFIRDRVASVNGLILNSLGKRTLLINTRTALLTHRAVSQQIYGTDGLPKKDGVLDNRTDALGYVCYTIAPIRGKSALHIR